LSFEVASENVKATKLGGLNVLKFKELFGVPIGHALRWVKPQEEARVIFGPWEHEEYDCNGGLVAVYESWTRKDSGFRFVKYSPYGWVLSISGRSPRLLPLRAAPCPLASTSQRIMLRKHMGGR
jgi:hypothetical protein